MKDYEPFVCLPYIDIPGEISLGPVHFAGKMVSLAPQIPDEIKIPLLVDAIHLLYFAAFDKSLYYNVDAPYFEYFTYLTPATEPFSTPEQRIPLPPIDPEMSKALGSLLHASYLDDHRETRTIVRSIRYFTHCFSGAFSLPFGDAAFEPEDMVFLVTAFETLFGLDPANPVHQFKKILRPMIQVKYGRPLEVFWKWIDHFYTLHKAIIQEGKILDSTFRENPNFEINTLIFAIKLFIYAVHVRLHTLGLTEAPKVDPIEITYFLWTEEGLLQKISLLLMDLVYKGDNQENLDDLHLLARNYAKMLADGSGEAVYHPSEKGVIEKPIISILTLSGETIVHDNKTTRLVHFFPDGFLERLQKRVA